MKTLKLVLGSISCIAGLILFFMAEMEKSSSWGYTWRPPYSSYESQVLMCRWIGIALLVCGAIDLILCMISAKYTSDKIQDVNQVYITKCPSCGIRLDSEVKICPKCRTSVKEN